MATAEIGVFGGSGFYSFLDDVEDGRRSTPPSARRARRSAVGTVGGRRVAFLPRHGQRAHDLARARSRSGRTSGRCDRSAFAPSSDRAPRARCAPTSQPGDFVVLDQLVDRTRGRADTFYDGDHVHHVSFADPYCPVGRTARDRCRGTRRCAGARRRDDRRDQRPALLDARGVALVPRAGLGRRQHDAVSRGVPRARARHALHRHRARHRLRHRRRGRSRGRARHQDQVLAVFDANVRPRARAPLRAAAPAARGSHGVQLRVGTRPAAAHVSAATVAGERSLARRSGRATTDGPGIRTGDLVPKRDAG